jgi:uncharacterized protein (DUF302 family)/extradiol dioxygenase family protein
MSVIGLDHVQLAMPAGGEADARGFYADVLGLPEIPKPADFAQRGGCWFETHAVKIHLGVDSHFHPATKAHPGLLVDDLQAIGARCRDKGYELLPGGGAIDGFERLFVKDPFGNRLELLQKRAAPSQQAPGIVRRRSRYAFDDTVSRLTSAIESKGATLFAVVDHAGEAARVGLSMPPTKLLIFGNPKAGTPLMLAAPSLAIDLPLKVLVWGERDGSAWMAFNDAHYLADRHGLARAQSTALAAVDALTAALAAP